MTTWPAPAWPRREVLPPLDPRTQALADVVDAFLCGNASRTDLQRAWQIAVGRRSR